MPCRFTRPKGETAARWVRLSRMTHPMGRPSTPESVTAASGVSPPANRRVRTVRRRCAGPSKLLVSLVSIDPSVTTSLSGQL